MSVPLTPEDFRALDKTDAGEAIHRPIVTYWQDVWRHLKGNVQAMVCLYIVVALGLFTLLGPVFWPVDPYAQDPSLPSKAPYFNLSARLVDPLARHQPILSAGHPPLPNALYYQSEQADLPRPSGLKVMGRPHTYSVKLSWQPVDHAARYHIYRHYRPPDTVAELGLPLGDTQVGNRVSYEDRLKLANRTYYYSVVADDGNKQSSHFSTIAVKVEQAVSFNQARAQGLIEGQGAGVRQVTLPARPLGTDYLGRDLMARLMHGARSSLFIGVFAPLCFVAFGMIYGALAGFLGGRIDGLMMRIADFVVALPFLLFVILFRVLVGIQSGESGIKAIMLALILLLWPATARLVRGQILQIKTQAYVESARLLGSGNLYLIFRQMLPNVMGPVLVTLTFAIPSAIFIEAFLSFIGMGVAPPVPSWGSSCLEGLKTMLTHPHELFFPAFLISLTVLAFNLLGDGLRDALDARLRGKT